MLLIDGRGQSFLRRWSHIAVASGISQILEAGGRCSRAIQRCRGCWEPEGKGSWYDASPVPPDCVTTINPAGVQDCPSSTYTLFFMLKRATQAMDFKLCTWEAGDGRLRCASGGCHVDDLQTAFVA